MNINLKSKNYWQIIAVIYITSLLFNLSTYTNKYNVSHVSNELLLLIADYEGVNVLNFETDQDLEQCLRSYDVGDGVVTFGLGKTFNTEIDGINHINELNNTTYNENDCIKLEHLMKIHEEDISIREKKILSLDKKYKTNINQQQFDAIMLMFYLNEDSINSLKFWNLLSNEDLTKISYIDYFINIYSQFNQYETYKAGWNARIEDSADIFFDSQYTRDY